MEDWRPVVFEAEIEREYSQNLLKRYIPLGRLAMGVGAFSFVGYAPWDMLLDPAALEKTAPIRLATVFHFLIGIGLTFLPNLRTNPRYWPFFMSYIYCGYVVLFTLILSQLPGGFVAGVGGFILGMIFMPAITNGPGQAAVVVLPQLIATLLTMFLTGGTAFELLNVLAWVGGGAGFTIAFAYLLDVINRRAFDLERQLQREKLRSDALLLNVLPVDIATRLKAKEDPVVDAHNCVSVLFADLAGFTNMSRCLKANELVDMLNDLFSRFDKLAESHSAEKIKTIGDAYMVATGLSGNLSNHAERIADLALGMQLAFEDFRSHNGVDLNLRIGIHSGSVIAGVIGKQKFSYDLWGNTVNVASRMESEGLPDKIQISAETKELLPENYQTSPRGRINIKGHRSRETFLLENAE